VRSKSIDFSSLVEAERARRLQQVRQSFEDLLCWLTSSNASRFVHDVDDGLATRLQHLGGLLVALWVACRLQTKVPAKRRYGRGEYLLRGLEEAPLRSRFGQLTVPRTVYRLTHGKGPALISPDDRRLGLAAGRMSLSLHLTSAYLAAKMCFDDAVQTLRDLRGYGPSKRSILGIVDTIGPKADVFLDQQNAPEDDGEILVIQVDAKGAPMISHKEHAARCRPHKKRPRGQTQRQRRRCRRRQKRKVRKKTGDKSKNARMANVGVIYTLRRLPDGRLEGPIHKRVLGTFKGPQVLFERLSVLAKRRGYGTDGVKTIFLADGAHHLWDLQKKHFPEATPCLDWYHLSEYLWKAASTVHRGDRAKVKREKWVDLRKEELRTGDTEAVLTAMRALTSQIGKTGPGTKTRRKQLADSIRYVDNHRRMLTYKELMAQDLDIATGAIEGAVKHSVGARLDGSGMRWSCERSEHVLALRCVLINGDWSEFSEVVTKLHNVIKAWEVPRITPNAKMTPHTAKRKKAA
jgi:hypothetical protein